jgi:hypothetical protein
MLREVFIVIRTDWDKDEIQVVCDSEWLALKRLSYFETANPNHTFLIKQCRLEISAFD